MPGINFNMEEQEETLWCWAAVSVSVDKSLPPRQSTMEQCDLAATVLGAAGCCGNSRPASCNNEAALRDGLTAVGRPPGGSMIGPLAFNDLNAELTSGRPVCVVIQWNEAQILHFAVISKSYTKRHVKMLLVQDPDTGEQPVEYEKFKSEFSYSGHGKWIGSYRI
jgi:hypothetical protein